MRRIAWGVLGFWLTWLSGWAGAAVVLETRPGLNLFFRKTGLDIGVHFNQLPYPPTAGIAAISVSLVHINY